MSLSHGHAVADTVDVKDHFRIGVYYYPGWRDDTSGSVSIRPWQALLPYPMREPLLGYYRDGEPEVMARQIEWMAAFGIDFVVFDWYWNHKLGALKTHAIDAFFNSKSRHGLYAALMWANHTEFPESVEQFDRMVQAWLVYFSHREYLTLDGKPVVFVFSVERLEERANGFGNRSGILLDRARAIAEKAGYRGIYFIGAVGANSKALSAPNGLDGFDALSAYNYHGPATFRYAAGHHESHSYAELDQAYRDHWYTMMERSSLPFVLPMTTGWDRRPWGGSKDPLHDMSVGTPDEFGAHLVAAREMMSRFSQKTLRIGIICCWNEYGEGSILEPTKGNGFSFLERVAQVFGAAK